MYAYVTYICDIYIYIYLFCAATFQTHRCKQSHITYSQLHTSFSYILTHILHSLLPIFRFSDRTDIMTFFFYYVWYEQNISNSVSNYSVV